MMFYYNNNNIKSSLKTCYSLAVGRLKDYLGHRS